MALSEFEKEKIEKIFTAYCEKKVPLHIRDQFRVEFEIRGNEVKLFEFRPYWKDTNEWIPQKVARFKKDPGSNSWTLYWTDRNGRWHVFEPYPSSRDITKLLAEVDNDKTGIFWG